MMMPRIAKFFDDRFGSNVWIRAGATKIFPDHWSFYLGEFALYCFLLLVVTGVWLTFVYDPSPERAYASVTALSRSAPLGYLIRQIHHWSAVIFVAAILVHMCRIFFTAAFRRPREVNWVIGFLMLVLASVTGFTGYSLPNDSLSGVGLRIADSVLLSIPLIGPWAANVFTGGGYPGPDLFPHLYTIHVYFLPIAIAALLSLHLAILIYQKHSQFVPDEKQVVGRRLWPDYALRGIAALGLTIGLIIFVSSFVEINPVENYGPYADWSVPNPATPDWYAAFLDGALRLGPAFELQIFGHPIPPIFWPGIVLPTIALAILIGWPWIDRMITHDDATHHVLCKPTDAPWRTGVGVGLLAAGIILTLAAGDDQQAFALHIDVRRLVWFYRIVLPLGSVGAGLIAARIAQEIRDKNALGVADPQRAVLRRTAEGGYQRDEAETV